jgi:hypothetical protein
MMAKNSECVEMIGPGGSQMVPQAMVTRFLARGFRAADSREVEKATGANPKKQAALAEARAGLPKDE